MKSTKTNKTSLFTKAPLGTLAASLCLLAATAQAQRVPWSTVLTQSASLTSSQQEDTVQTIAFDPAFVEYAQAAIRLTGKSSNVVKPLDANGRAAAAATAKQLKLDIEAGAAAEVTFPRLTSLTTVTQDDFTQLRILGLALNNRFPSLANSGATLYGQAIQANPELADAVLDTFTRGEDGDIEEEEDEEDELVDCLDDCLDEYTSDHNTNIAIFAIETAICTGLVVWPPVSAACFATALTDQLRRELETTSDYDNCQDACMGIPPEGECSSDYDCASNEWCDTGTLSIGDNECAPDKFIGEVCSRDAKCLSGCCKFDFWQHPVSMTCNPADDCE